MSWTKKQIKQHKQAAEALRKIIKKIVEFIKYNPETTDVAIRQFIKKRYKRYHLKSDKQKSIVAFGKSTAHVHYYAEKPRRLKKGDIIMIDIWARLEEIGAPFADITWMMYYGRKLPKQHVDAFRIVAQAREMAIKYLQSNLKNKTIPLGKEIDDAARNYLNDHGLAEKFLHSTGHSLGLVSPHGRRTRISRKGRQSLPLNIGYTIEPGIYFKNKFGVRSEIDFYIDENYKLIITTICQKQIIKIWKKS
ncbi:MAG: M24 family metallopeptidase [Patescibacteria group bacterium]|jgi:Xaa-Pro aminopeptidase